MQSAQWASGTDSMIRAALAAAAACARSTADGVATQAGQAEIEAVS